MLRFAASFLWADLEVANTEREFLHTLARELGLNDAGDAVDDLLDHPPLPEDVDPNDVINGEIAELIRSAALRAIAADGVVMDEEMKLFELLDDLLPRSPSPLRSSHLLPLSVVAAAAATAAH